MINISNMEKLEYIQKSKVYPHQQIKNFLPDDISDFDKSILLQVGGIFGLDNGVKSKIFKIITFFPYFYFDKNKYYYLGNFSNYHIVGKITANNNNMGIYYTFFGNSFENEKVFVYLNNNILNFLYFIVQENKFTSYCFEIALLHGKGKLTQKQANDIIIKEYKEIQEIFWSCDEQAMNDDNNYWKDIINSFPTILGDFLEEIP